MKIIKNYGKKNTLLIRIAVAVKSFTGAMVSYAYFSKHNPDLALAVFAIGALANEIINIFGNENNSNTNNNRVI